MKKLPGILSLSIIVLLTAASISYSNTYEIIQLTHDDYIDAFPQINESGDVVWEGSGPLTSDKEIYFYDRCSGEITELTHDGYADMAPKINANGVVVWYAYGAGDEWEIFLYDGSTIIKLTDNDYDDWGHQINANGEVVWHGYGNLDPTDSTTDAEIFLYEGSLPSRQLTDNDYDDEDPQINAEGDVVWHGQTGSSSDSSEIFYYDASEGTITPISNNSYRNRYPQINASGDVVWYGKDEDGNYEIFLYDGGPMPMQLTSDDPPLNNLAPQINANGDVVWVRRNDKSGNTQIFFYDRSTGTTEAVPLSDDGQYPQINAQGHVVWYNPAPHYKDISFYNGSQTTLIPSDNTYLDVFPQINSNGDVVWFGYIQGVGGSEIFLATTDPDKDDDGIHDDVDEDPLEPSTRFSDIPLGGTTSGRILWLGPEITIEIMDAPDPDDGVKVLVSGTGVALIKIDGSTGIYILAPGEHVLTSGSVRLDVLQGSAEVEFIIGGATVVVSVVEGTVSLEETIVDGELQELVVNAIQGDVTVNGEVLPVGESVTITSVSIDIKPGSCPNPFNVNSKGVLPVAILGTEDFDVTTIDPATIKIARDGIDEGVSPLRWAHEDVATPFEDDLCECHELNGDGYLDLTLKFKRKEVAETLKLWQVLGQTIPLTITGNLLEEHGGTSITGQDCMWIKPKAEGKAKLEPIDNSGVYGKAKLVTRTDGTTKVVLKKFTGLMPGETYEATVRSGSCDGVILFSLSEVIVDEEGVGRSFTIVDATIDFDTWWIEVEGLTCGQVKLR